METKEFFNVISRRNNVVKMLDYALQSEGLTANVESQNAALGVLTALIQQYPERKKEKDRRKQ